MAYSFPAKLSVDMPKTFGEQLAGWREERGLNKAELARLVGISATHLGTIEKDISPSARDNKPPLLPRDLCDAFARALQLPRVTVYLAAYVPEMLDKEPDDVLARRILATIQGLPVNRQRDVLAIADMFWRESVMPNASNQ